jgi:two-component system, OmpR family, response regulator
MTATGTAAGSPLVLIVEDDEEISGLLRRYLIGQGLRADVAATGAALRERLRQGVIDVVLLDLGLPDEDGLSLMRHLRSQWRGPVIIVSGRGDSVERVIGLELGADDYVSKPFDLRELLARIRSVLRRAQPAGVAEEQPRDDFAFDGFRLRVASRQLFGVEGHEIELTAGEFDLLHALLQHPHTVLSRDQLMNRIHGRDAGPFDRAIDVQIGRLRRKIEADPAHPRIIRSVRGAGYLCAATVRRN